MSEVVDFLVGCVPSFVGFLLGYTVARLPRRRG